MAGSGKSVGRSALDEGSAGEGGAHLDIAGSAPGTNEVLRTLVGFGHLQHKGMRCWALCTDFVQRFSG